nr:uncharacterized protein LOC109166388 isoform X1 [Ipomoea trifida]
MSCFLRNVIPPASRSSNYTVLRFRNFPLSTAIGIGENADCFHHMVVFQYGSAVLFNVDDDEAECYLQTVRRYATGLLRGMKKDDSIRVISSVLGQSIALDYFVSQIDGMVEEFANINREMERIGNFTMDQKKLFQLFGKANSNLADVILKVGLFERSEIAWRDAKYAQILEYLSEEYEVTQHFANLNFKLKFVEVSICHEKKPHMRSIAWRYLTELEGENTIRFLSSTLKERDLNNLDHRPSTLKEGFSLRRVEAGAGALLAVPGSGITDLEVGGALPVVPGSGSLDLEVGPLPAVLGSGSLDLEVGALPAVPGSGSLDLEVGGALPPVPGSGITDLEVGGALPAVPGSGSLDLEVGGALLAVPGSGITDLEVGGALPAVPGSGITDLEVGGALPAVPGSGSLDLGVGPLPAVPGSGSGSLDLEVGEALPAVPGSGITDLEVGGALPAVPGTGITDLEVGGALLAVPGYGITDLEVGGALPAVPGSGITDLEVGGALPAVPGSGITDLEVGGALPAVPGSGSLDLEVGPLPAVPGSGRTDLEVEALPGPALPAVPGFGRTDL